MTKFYPPAIIRSVTKDKCISYLLPRATLTLFAQSISIGNGILNEEEGEGRRGKADRETFILILQERGGRENSIGNEGRP